MDPPAPDIPRLGLSDALLVSEEEKTELDKILELLLRPENIGHNTELTRNEILAFSVLTTIAKKYTGLTVLGDFLRENLVLRVSKGRAGRKEWVKIVGAAREQSFDFNSRFAPTDPAALPRRR